MSREWSRRNVLKAFGAGGAAMVLRQPAAAAATKGYRRRTVSSSGIETVAGSFFRLRFDISRGATVTDVQLFDGTDYRPVNADGHGWPEVYYGEYGLHNATDGRLISRNEYDDRVTLQVSATPITDRGVAASFRITQTIDVYDAGVVDVVATTSDPSKPSVSFALNQRAFPRSAAFNPGASYSHAGVTDAGYFLSTRDSGYSNGFQTWSEGPYAIDGAQTSGWGFVLAAQRQENTTIGRRIVTWQEGEGNNVVWPPNSYIDACADIGVNLSLVHIYWKKYQWGEANYRHSGNFGDLRRFIEYNKTRGITPVLYGMPHYNPSAEPYAGIEPQWYEATGAEGIYFDFASNYAGPSYDLPLYRTLQMHNYSQTNAHFRRVVGESGILIAHSGVWAPDLHFNAFCDAYLPGEAVGQDSLVNSQDAASVTGGLAYSVVHPWTIYPTLRDDEAFSTFAGAGMYPHALMGHSTHPGYGSGDDTNRNPFLTLQEGFAPYFQYLRAIPMGVGTKLYNFNTEPVLESTNSEFWHTVYRRQSSDETLILSTNRAPADGQAKITPDASALGMSGSYERYLITGNTIDTLKISDLGRSRSLDFSTPTLSQYGYSAMLFSKLPKRSYVASVNRVLAAYTDRTPPSEVMGVRAEDIGKAVRLNWEPARDNHHVAAYYVYRSDAGGSYKRVNTERFDYEQITWFTDKDLVPGTTYRYRVSAVDVAGNEGKSSAPASVTVGGGSTPPGSDYTAVKLLSVPVATTPAKGLRFRYVDDANYYSVHFGGNGGGEGGLYLSRVLGGTVSTLAWVGFAYWFVPEHVLRIEAYGPKLRLYSDGIFQLEATDSALTRGSIVGADLITYDAAFGASVVHVSSQRRGAEAANIVDGDIKNSRWETTSDDPQQVVLDLGETPVSVGVLRLKAAFDIDNPGDITIGDRFDSTNPRRIAIYGSTSVSASSRKHVLVPPTDLPQLMSCRDVSLLSASSQPIRYLQLDVESGYDRNRMVLGELEVFPVGARAKAAQVSVVPDHVVAAVGDSAQFSAVATSQYGDPIDTGQDLVTWRSANPDVAVIDASGLLTIRAAGATTVTATIDGSTSKAAPVISYPNLARNKPVTAFSAQLDATTWAAANATDGRVDATSRGWAATGTGQWIVVDLGGSHQISALSIEGEDSLDNRNIKDYQLFGSDTGEFTGEEKLLDAGTVPPLQHLTTWATLIQPGSARYVKLLGTTSYSPYTIVGEFGLYGE